MKTRIFLCAGALALPLALGGCQAGAGRAGPARLAPAQAEVYRAHGGTVAPGALLLAPADLSRGGDPREAAFIAAVSERLEAHGFARSDQRDTATYLGSVRVVSGTSTDLDRDLPDALRGAPGATAAAVGTALIVQLHRASDGALVWQGRSSTFLPPRGPVESLAPLLARALLEDFPGPSGRTIRR